MTTLAEYKTWLSNPLSIPNIIGTIACKANGVETTLKVTLRKYKNYLPVLEAGLSYSEEWAIDNQPSISISGLKFNNINGQYDYVLKYIFSKRDVTFSIGDVSWDESSYVPILSCKAVTIKPDGDHYFTLVLGDKLQQLNNPVSEYKVKDFGLTTNENDNLDTIVPILIGECANIVPILFNKLTREYKYSIGPSRGLIEIRDDERPMSLESENQSTASFIPKFKILGELTCSAQGHLISGTTWTNRIGALCAALAMEGGNANTKFISSEIDWSSINAFDSAFPYPIGYYSTSKENMLVIMQALASSVQAQVYCSRLGLLRIDYLRFTSSVATISNKFLTSKVSHSDYIAPIGTVSLNYCKNWNPQTVTNAVVDSSKELLKKEWQIATKTNSSIISEYRLSATATPRDTYLIRKADAETEAQRELDFWKVPRNIYELKLTRDLLWLETGQTVTLNLSRYGLENSLAIIMSMNYNWTAFEVTIKVIV